MIVLVKFKHLQLFWNLPLTLIASLKDEACISYSHPD